ncbi:MAG TPA: hypothetical protein VHJ78_02610 [Actinomycetota bacterium]|nr:hypothetical protein [Actinomycetota bacterium]
MAKTKQPAPRKPVKARGALPAPKVAPQRDTTPWYKKTRTRVLFGIAALLVLAFVVNLVLDARERAESRRRDVRAVEQFERRVQDLNLDIQGVYQALGEAPGAFLAGAIPQPEFRTAAEGWVESFRRLNQRIRAVEIPADIEGLQETKAHYVQASTIYIDAAKMFVAAADTPDPAARERATVLARNTFVHAVAVYSMGDRELTKLKNEFELNDPPEDPPAPTLPEEEPPMPPPAPAAPPAAPGTVNPSPAASAPAASPAPASPSPAANPAPATPSPVAS